MRSQGIIGILFALLACSAAVGTDVNSGNSSSCAESKVASLQGQYTACFHGSDSALNATAPGVSKEAFKMATCKRITEQHNCSLILAECMPDFADLFLLGEFLGPTAETPSLQPFPAFVKSCPVLERSEFGLVKKQFKVSENCTFDEVRRVHTNETLNAGTQCIMKASMDLQVLVAELGTTKSDAIIQSICNEAKSLDKCEDLFGRCNVIFNEMSKTGLLQTLQDFVRVHVADFSFEKTCGN